MRILKSIEELRQLNPDARINNWDQMIDLMMYFEGTLDLTWRQVSHKLGAFRWTGTPQGELFWMDAQDYASIMHLPERDRGALMTQRRRIAGELMARNFLDTFTKEFFNDAIFDEDDDE